MIPDRTPNTSSDAVKQSPDEPEVEPIAPEAAAALLDGAIQPYLDDGWHILDRSAYAVRLTRGMRNLDVRVDLLGQIEKQESGLTPLQDSGRLMAWMLLLAMLLVVMAVATVLGII
jgi:hypothetical protein